MSHNLLPPRLESVGPDPEYARRSGRFCGAVPEQGFIQQTGHPGNDGYIGKVKDVPVEAEVTRF